MGHRKIILKMQASLCFFLGIIVLVQIGNAYPKNKGASQAEEADSTKNERNLSDLKKETAKDINYLLDLFCPFLKLSDPSKNFSLDREAAKDYLKQNPGLGLLQTLTGPLCGVLFLANKTTSDAGLSRTKRAAKASTLPGIVSSDKKAVRDLINKVASDVSSLLSPKWAAKLSNLADKFRHDTLVDTVALLLSLTEKADGKEKAAKLSNLVKIFSFDRKAARELVDKVVNEVSSLLRLAEEADGTKKAAKMNDLVEKLFHDKKAATDLANKVANEVAPVLSLAEEADGTKKAAKLSNLVKKFSLDKKAAKDPANKVPQRMAAYNSIPIDVMIEGVQSCPQDKGAPVLMACIWKHTKIWCDHPSPCYGLRRGDEANECAKQVQKFCWGWE